MSALVNDLEQAYYSFNPTPAVYEITRGWGTSLTLRNRTSPKSNRNDFIVDMISKSVSQKLDINTGKHTLVPMTEQVVSSVRYEMVRYFAWFVSSYADTKNNKLTKTYKWLNTIPHNNIQQNIAMENDLWHIFKWLKTTVTHSEETKKAALQLIELMYQKYEKGK